MAGQRMRSYEMTEIVHRGLEECLTEAFGIALDDCDGVFLSVDIDVCDQGMRRARALPSRAGSAPASSSTQSGGSPSRPVVGMDVVEVAPPYDHAEITAALANRVVLEALSALARRQQDERDGTTWDPAQPLLDGRTPPEADPEHHDTHLGHD